MRIWATARSARLGVRVLLAAMVCVGWGGPAHASEQETLVEQARLTVETFAGDPKMAAMRTLLKDAKGVLVIPQLFRAGFIIGGADGIGVLLGRNGEWSAPAFYTMASGVIGLHIGRQFSEVVLVLMTARAIDAIIHRQIKLGTDVSVAAGPHGAGVEAAGTTTLLADIYAFARAKGPFAGDSLAGVAIKARRDWNRKYYREPLSARQIVLLGKGANPHADGLKQALDAAIAAP